MRERRGSVVIVGLGGLLLAATTHAAPRKRASVAEKAAAPVSARPLAAEALADLRKRLRGEDESAAIAAVKTLGASAAPNASEVLAEVLAVGTTPTVATEALAALERLRDPKSVQVLVLYAGNRNVPVRKAALRALGSLPDERVVATLIERLGDNETEVRAVAAEALAARKDTRAAPRLFKLVAKNDAGAAPALGLLIAPEEVPQLAELRGRIDDSVLASALGEFIKRPEVSDRLRVDVVRTLARIPGAAATTALVEYLTTVPENDTRASKEEAQKIVDNRGAL